MADETVAVQARTSLEAMNTILATIASSPVTNYNDTANLDVVMARQVLEETSAEVQEMGWRFNSDDEYEMEPNGSDEIVLSEVFTVTGYTPSEIARIDFNRCKNQYKDLIVRGGKVYDKTEHSYTFTKKVYADLVWYLPWTSLPNSIRYYITVRAARKFADRRLSSETVRDFTLRDEQQAYSLARRDEIRVSSYNALKNIPALQRREVR